ncbi:patatin-like phospholipase family protein [Luminiphilus sp.]|jgi:patatin-like phospholipase/acyl hydrolase|nr:patatin-like phospholipase family protein [Luminiphilus sp.]
MSKPQTAGNRPRRVLSIDGGGIRGIIPAMVVAHIERKLNKPAHELFDLLVGTSTGGILALGLSRPGANRPAQFSARRVVKLYEEQGANIFEYSLWRKLRTVGGILDEAYSHEVLEDILGKYFAGATLADCEVPTMVTSYDIQNRRTVFLKSWHGDHQPLLCRDAARATSAAPTYFEPKPLDTGDVASVLIDGGIFMNSPSVSAYAEARKLFPDDPIAVLSLGTGELTQPIPFEEARTWGSALRVMSLLDCMFDGVSKAADHQMRLFLGERYYRLQTSLDTASDDIDDASAENIGSLKTIARDLIKQNEAALVQFFTMESKV